MNAKQNKAVDAQDDASVDNMADQKHKNICGIIMPIADMEQYDPGHWTRVKGLIEAAAELSGYRARLVSESEDIGVIHSRIVENIHDDPIVVCDVSGKNANVMFELGLRLAFDKPVIIIIDEKTGYSFDTSPIEHISYRSDMRYKDTIEFIESLAKKIKSTVERKKNDKNYSPFVGHFGKFTVTNLKEVQGTSAEYISHRLNEMQRTLDRMVSLQSASMDIESVATARVIEPSGLVRNAGLRRPPSFRALNIVLKMLKETGITDPEQAFPYAKAQLIDNNIPLSDIQIMGMVKRALSEPAD